MSGLFLLGLWLSLHAVGAWHTRCLLDIPSTSGKPARPSFSLRMSTAPAKRKKKVDPALAPIYEKYEPVIGIEVHVQLLSETKAYCSCSTKYNPNIPNTNICPVCMGEPGALPVPNQKVLEIAAKAAMALDCTVSDVIKFDRKNYYYPDTPKNYQITQYDKPIGEHGHLDLPTGERIRVHRLHMEEDSAKMLHQGSGSLAHSTHTLVDFNRAGIPLAEIVSEPDMHTPETAVEYAKELQRVLRYMGASDGNMAEGSFRLDVNVSLRPKGSKELRTKVEMKNLNSFRSVQLCIEHEVKRQAKCYDSGEPIRQETRMWDEKALESRVMRVKEGESDYRYFTEPDIPIFSVSSGLFDKWRTEMCELPAQKRERYVSALGLDADTARVITDDVTTMQYFEQGVSVGADPREFAKWLTGDVAGTLSNLKLALGDAKLKPQGLADMLSMVASGEITGRIAKEILPALLQTWDGSVESYIDANDMRAIRDVATVEAFMREVMNANPDKVSEYRSGKTKLLGFFVGQLMTTSGGRADPTVTSEVVPRVLNEC